MYDKCDNLIEINNEIGNKIMIIVMINIEIKSKNI